MSLSCPPALAPGLRSLSAMTVERTPETRRGAQNLFVPPLDLVVNRLTRHLQVLFSVLMLAEKLVRFLVTSRTTV